MEDHLSEDIHADDVAQQVYASKDYFQKAFGVVTGLTVSEYIRNRRLALAGQEQRQTKMKVIDIAMKYHYETPESVTKAFARFHGFSPSAARSKANGLKRFLPLSIQIHVKGGFNMSRKIISKVPVRQLISDAKGQNYWLNGCMEFLMECLGEDTAYYYWFFSGVTGDSFLQLYSKNPRNMALCYSHNMTEEALQKAFDACGYYYDYYNGLGDGDSRKYDKRIREYIDKDIPVIARVDDAFHSFAIICGYDENSFYVYSGGGQGATIVPL